MHIRLKSNHKIFGKYCEMIQIHRNYSHLLIIYEITST